MIPALLIITGAITTLSALIALIAGVSLGTTLLGAAIATFALVGLLVTLAMRQGTNPGEAEIQAELAAMRETLASDSRFGTASPESLSPKLHRSLMRREQEIDRAGREESEMVIRVSR